jgi:hypothetical protein
MSRLHRSVKHSLSSCMILLYCFYGLKYSPNNGLVLGFCLVNVPTFRRNALPPTTAWLNWFKWMQQWCGERACVLYRMVSFAKFPQNILYKGHIFFHCIISAPTWNNSVTPKMEVICSFKTSEHFTAIRNRYAKEVCHLKNHHWDNLRQL